MRQHGQKRGVRLNFTVVGLNNTLGLEPDRSKTVFSGILKIGRIIFMEGVKETKLK